MVHTAIVLGSILSYLLVGMAVGVRTYFHFKGNDEEFYGGLYGMFWPFFIWFLFGALIIKRIETRQENKEEEEKLRQQEQALAQAQQDKILAEARLELEKLQFPNLTDKAVKKKTGA